MRLDKQAKAAVAALEDIKARDIVVLDVKKMTTLFDWIIIATADSNRQARALATHLREKTKELGGRVRSVEGERTGEWVLVDLGAIVVHIMQPAIRKYYNLEELWAPAPRPRRRRAADAKN
jgi:ribosome-associated protein